MLKVINVVGARPNFMKVAPIVAAMKCRSSEFQSFMVHTGQHYDPKMSDAFFSDLDMPEPDIYLGVGSGSHADKSAIRIPELWDGHTAERLLDALIEAEQRRNQKVRQNCL